MSRFGNNSLSLIQKKVIESKPKNTILNHQYIWRQFMDFINERNYSLNENTSIPTLANILTDWAYNMKKKDGEDYKDFTVKTIWNVTSKLLMEKYQDDFNVKFNPFTDTEFKTAREAKNAKRKQLQTDPQKRKESALSLKYEEFKAMVQNCDEETPDGLQKKLFFVLSYELAWRGGEGVKCLASYFKEDINNAGEKTGRMEYNPIFDKTTQGGDKPCAPSKWLIKNKVNPDLCPVRLLRKFFEKRNKINIPRLFLTVNPFWKLGKWYKNIPVGKNLITRWTSTEAKKSGLATEKVKITNHSLRATAVSKLAKQGVEENTLIKITGHSNPKSIKSYLQLDEEHHSNIVGKMREANDKANVSTETNIANVSTINSLSSNTMENSHALTTSAADSKNTNFYNCVFHCNSCNF